MIYQRQVTAMGRVSPTGSSNRTLKARYLARPSVTQIVPMRESNACEHSWVKNGAYDVCEICGAVVSR